jgi:23S rRNA (guanosine2251-2'-O)-methyltransferase
MTDGPRNPRGGRDRSAGGPPGGRGRPGGPGGRGRPGGRAPGGGGPGGRGGPGGHGGPGGRPRPGGRGAPGGGFRGDQGFRRDEGFRGDRGSRGDQGFRGGAGFAGGEGESSTEPGREFRPRPGARGGRPGGSRPGGYRPGGGFGAGDRPPRDDEAGGGPRRGAGFARDAGFEDRPRFRDRDAGFEDRQGFRGPRQGRGGPPPYAGRRPGRPGGSGGPGPFGPAEGYGRPSRPAAAATPLEEGEELIAGRRPVEEAFSAGRPAKRLLVTPSRRQALERIVLHATTLRIPIVEVEGGSLTSLAGFDGHQGVALVVEERRFASPDEVVARGIERGEPAFVLVLDSLEDPQNVGTLLRSAEAVGVHGVVFPTERQAPLSPAAVKASAGATEHLLLAPVDDLPGALTDLHLRGLRIVGSDSEASLTARDADLRGPIALVVGSEGHGLSPAVRRRCDMFVRLPMRGSIGSLNAAVAGSILLFEVIGQRGATGGAGSSMTGAPEPTSETTLPPASRKRTRTAKPLAARQEAGPVAVSDAPVDDAPTPEGSSADLAPPDARTPDAESASAAEETAPADAPAPGETPAAPAETPAAASAAPRRARRPKADTPPDPPAAESAPVVPAAPKRPRKPRATSSATEAAAAPPESGDSELLPP